MNSEDRIRDLVRRVVRKVLAERGQARFPDGRAVVSGVARAPGVHVEIHPVGRPLRQATGYSDQDATLGTMRGADLVSRLCLEATPDGGSYVVERGAIITDLAREEVWKRRIVLRAHTCQLRASDDRVPS